MTVIISLEEHWSRARSTVLGESASWAIDALEDHHGRLPDGTVPTQATGIRAPIMTGR